ncbi:MAG TPA: UDP-N-acetylglucosamine 1-carboxyvinyltransferase, partial [Draconibacterium sp.]|nr:UDP-N-acetylglucosamine 1-carboxyvinyltransferase [Draconibacterium sp.]
MSTFKIEGGYKLKGDLEPQGAKNEALQIICATLLTPEETIVENIPEIRDVLKLIEILKGLGVKIKRLAKGHFSFNAAQVDINFLKSSEYAEQAAVLRGSIMIIGPLLSRFGLGFIPQPGGDKIGRRRVDTHFIGLQKLGAKFEFDRENKWYSVSAQKLIGAYMLLDEASVTGTANIVMAAVLARGTTTIYNAACEPYLQQLCKMLVSMGAKIGGIGSNLLTIEGVT